MLVIAHRQENRALVREVVAVVVQQVVTTWAKLLRAHFEKLEQMVEVFGGLAQGDSLNSEQTGVPYGVWPGSPL